MYMKKVFLTLAVLCAVAMMAGCKGDIDFANVRAYTASDDEHLNVDSINGYSTFSTDGRLVVIPEEITREQYERLLTDRYTVQPVAVDTGSSLYAELYQKGSQNAIRYYLERGLMENEVVLENVLAESDYLPIIHYPETKQYEFALWSPMTYESFMMTEEGIVDSTFMQSEGSTYGTNGIFVGQQGHDCDFHGDLWFYWYDVQRHHMVPLCHYMDYRWSEDGVEQGFNICWISDNELLVAAVSNGNSEWGWAGGYKPTTLAPWGTPVYYKLKITIK